MSDEITCYDKDGKTYWSCGCVSWKEMLPNGQKAFVHRACDNKNCLVVTTLHEMSAEISNPVIHYRAEDVRWIDEP